MGSAKALEVFGWLAIIIGIIGGIVVIVAFGQRAVPGYLHVEEVNPVGIAIGIGIILEHLVFGVFLIVVAHIAGNVWEIKRKLFGEAADRLMPTGAVPVAKEDSAKKKEDYAPQHERPTENDKLAEEAGKTCWRCTHFKIGFISNMGKCDVFNYKVHADATCKHFEKQK